MAPVLPRAGAEVLRLKAAGAPLPTAAVEAVLVVDAVARLPRVEVKRQQEAAVVLLRKEEAERRPLLRPRRRNLPTAST